MSKGIADEVGEDIGEEHRSGRLLESVVRAGKVIQNVPVNRWLCAS
jgi:hypothetical protein